MSIVITCSIVSVPSDPPGAPSIPDIVDYDENMVELKWEPPLRDNGAPITGYILEMRPEGSHDFVKANETGPGCKGKIKGLTPGQKYEFRVRAVNKAGTGEPSEATTPHLAKARFREYRTRIPDRSRTTSVTSLGNGL